MVLLLALAIWSAVPRASFAGMLAAYAIAWLIVNAVMNVRPHLLRAALTRGQAIGLFALVALPTAAQAWRLFDRILEDEGLDAVDHAALSRLRLEAMPSIAPPLVAADRPQTFYVHAEGAREVAVRFGDAGPQIAARPLGHGVFRVEYDPRTHGRPDPPDGELRASIVVDGRAHSREMLAVEPLAHPRGLFPSRDRSFAVATSEETDEIVVLDRGGLLHRVAVDDGPSDARFVNEREIVVAHRYSSELAWVDAVEGRVTRRSALGPLAHRLAVARDGSRIAVGRTGERPEIAIIDARGDVLACFEPGYEPDHLAFGTGADTLVVSSVRPPALHRFRFDGVAWREDVPPLWLGRPAVTLAPSADGREVIVAVTDVMGEGPPHLGNHFVQDQLVTIDVERWAIVRRLLTAQRTSRQTSPGDVDRGVSPMGLDPQDDGSLWVAFAGTDDVWRLEPRAPFPVMHALDEHPLAAPHGVVALGDRIAVSSPSYGTIGLFTRDGRRTALVRLAPDDRTLMREHERALQRRIGERSFYESTRAGISCQSCHLHGGSDGSKHNIGGFTLVATLDARGLLGTPPYLRDGGYPRLASFDEVAATLYRGYLRRQGGRRLGLERFVEALPRPIPPRQLEGRDEARERRGLDVFVRARCPLCHAPPAFTNLGSHPIDALFPDGPGKYGGHALDTPSLLGLGKSAPYLVDGRAETLESVFREHDPAGRHGDTRGLDARELSDLVYFLEGL